MSGNSKATISGWGLVLPLLTVLFVGLKLTGHITWSWVWVLSPIWIGFSVSILLADLALGILAILGVKNK